MNSLMYGFKNLESANVIWSIYVQKPTLHRCAILLIFSSLLLLLKNSFKTEEISYCDLARKKSRFGEWR